MSRDGISDSEETWHKICTKNTLEGLSTNAITQEICLCMNQKKALYPRDANWAAKVLEQCLLTTDNRLLESILYGNIALDRLQDSKLAATLGRLRVQSQNQPATTGR